MRLAWALTLALAGCKAAPAWYCADFVHGEEHGDVCGRGEAACEAERKALIAGHREATACAPRPVVVCLEGSDRCFGTSAACEAARARMGSPDARCVTRE